MNRRHHNGLPELLSATVGFLPVALVFFAGGWATADDRAQVPDKVSGAASETRTARERLELPGVTINLAEHSIDVAGKVCLEEGMLELVACTKGSKEHESIVAVEAKAMHIHAALLLLDAKPGNPAMRKQLVDDETRWVDIPPKGGAVNVFLVIAGENGKPVERPISEFIAPADPADLHAKAETAAKKRFPTHTFLFAGSQLLTDGDGPRTYLADQSGNLISIVTFGDETLCLPTVHSHAKGELLWQIDPKHLPPVGSEVTLRLRPKPEPPATAPSQR